MPVFHRQNLKTEAGGPLLNFESVAGLMDDAVRIFQEEAPVYSGEDPLRIATAGRLRDSLTARVQQSERQATIVVFADKAKLGSELPILKFVLEGTRGGKIINGRLEPHVLTPLRFMDKKAMLAFYWKDAPGKLLHRRSVIRGSTPANRFDLRGAERIREILPASKVFNVEAEANRIFARLNDI